MCTFLIMYCCTITGHMTETELVELLIDKRKKDGRNSTYAELVDFIAGLMWYMSFRLITKAKYWTHAHSPPYLPPF